MKKCSKLVLVTVFIAIFTCYWASWAGKLEIIPEVSSEAEEGFRDLVFIVSNNEKQPNGSRILTAIGNAENQNIGFQIVLERSRTAGNIGNLPIYRTVVSMNSLGISSDKLLKYMDKLYGTKINPHKMAQQTKFTAISLEGNPSRLEDGPVKLKLFYESTIEDRYAEIFLNINISNNKVYLNEKDDSYRLPIIRALSGQIK